MQALRGAALAAALVGVVVLAAFGGMALLHRLGHATPTAPVAKHTGPQHNAVALRPRSRISVLVLNGNGINGAAGGIATRLLTHGYRHAVPADAPNHNYARSVVLFRPGWGAEAHRLAREVGARVAEPLDGSVAPAYSDDQLIVILGG